ncbi:MAG: glycosyl transferase family protein [Novosphingobium sp.]|nr:glycosyl transferase family protein [Novosphingobium sp.]
MASFGGGTSVLVWLQLVERELLLFALFWFILGLLDEAAIDLSWAWLRLTGRTITPRIAVDALPGPLHGTHAVLIPAWLEADVIAATVRHLLGAWPQPRLRVYVGCYRNDPVTLSAAMAGAGGDGRVRLVIHDAEGPTTKADCLNRLYAALADDEARSGRAFAGVILHDAEDMVHPLALPLIDAALTEVDFVQLPVRPEPQAGSRWVAGHYCDEFAEAHAKALVVRDALGAAIPAAGVGCGFSRPMLARVAEERVGAGEAGPFAAECLTEDYELGLIVARANGRSRFLRCRDAGGALIATRAYFPGGLDEAVRQKTRWTHGIALQGWDRLGWHGRPLEVWMALRDRRGLLAALVLAVAYVLVVVEGVLALAHRLGWARPLAPSPLVDTLLWVTFAGFMMRAAARLVFTGHEYGWREGIRAVLRIPTANLIAIVSGRRALAAYLASLRSGTVTWDKTVHRLHPARLQESAA